MRISTQHQGENGRYMHLRSCQGYLLIEILMAVAIFSIGFLAVGSTIVSTARNNTTADIITQASLLASETIERLKKERVVDLAPDNYNDPNNPVDELGRPGGIYHRRWTIDDPVGFNSSRRIRVTVSWNRWGQNRSVELTSITRGNGT